MYILKWIWLRLVFLVHNVLVLPLYGFFPFRFMLRLVDWTGGTLESEPPNKVTCVVVIVRDGDKYLVRFRDNTKYSMIDGAYEVPGGRVHANELAATAAYREGREECGLIFQKLKAVEIYDVPGNLAPNQATVCIVYEVTEWHGDVVDEPGKASWEWLTREEIIEGSRDVASAFMNYLGRNDQLVSLTKGDGIRGRFFIQAKGRPWGTELALTRALQSALPVETAQATPGAVALAAEGRVLTADVAVRLNRRMASGMPLLRNGRFPSPVKTGTQITADMLHDLGATHTEAKAFKAAHPLGVPLTEDETPWKVLGLDWVMGLRRIGRACEQVSGTTPPASTAGWDWEEDPDYWVCEDGPCLTIPKDGDLEDLVTEHALNDGLRHDPRLFFTAELVYGQESLQELPALLDNWLD